MKQNTHHLTQQTGFTLLETLVAFSLMSLLFLALFASFKTVSQSWDAAENRMQKTEDQRLILGWLRRQLQQTMVVRIKENKGRIYAFTGNESQVRFVAPLLPFNDKGGIYLQELFIKRENSLKSLYLKYAPYRPDSTWDDAFEHSQTVLIYSDLRQVQFEYFGTESIDDEPRWESEWEDKLVFPMLLRLNIETIDQEKWPPLVIDLPQVDTFIAPQTANSRPTTPKGRRL